MLVASLFCQELMKAQIGENCGCACGCEWQVPVVLQALHECV